MECEPHGRDAYKREVDAIRSAQIRGESKTTKPDKCGGCGGWWNAPKKKRPAKPQVDYETMLRDQIVANYLPCPRQQVAFHPTRGWRFDLAWPDIKVAVEIEGMIYARGRHTRGVGFSEDLEKYAEALIHGWRVLRVSTNMVKDDVAIELVDRMFKSLGLMPLASESAVS